MRRPRRACARSGFAVPMSMPAEHLCGVHGHDLHRPLLAPAASPSRFCRCRSARSGSSTGSGARRLGSSAATQEQPIQFLQRQTHPGRAGRDCIDWRALSVSICRSSASISGNDRRRLACTEVRHASVPENGPRHPRYGARRPGLSRSRATSRDDLADLRARQQRRHAAQRQTRRPERIQLKPGPLPFGRPSSSASSSCAASSTTSGSSRACEGNAVARTGASAARRAPARARRACPPAPPPRGLRQNVGAVHLRQRRAQRLRVLGIAASPRGARQIQAGKRRTDRASARRRRRSRLRRDAGGRNGAGHLGPRIAPARRSARRRAGRRRPGRGRVCRERRARCARNTKSWICANVAEAHLELGGMRIHIHQLADRGSDTGHRPDNGRGTARRDSRAAPHSSAAGRARCGRSQTRTAGRPRRARAWAAPASRPPSPDLRHAHRNAARRRKSSPRTGAQRAASGCSADRRPAHRASPDRHCAAGS